MLSKTSVEPEVLIMCMCIALYALDTEDFKQNDGKKRTELISAVIYHIRGIEDGI